MVVMCSRNTAWGTDSNIRNLGAGRKTLPQLGSSPGFGPHRLLDDYLPCHGHPHSNGQGHVLTKIDGKQFVKIPSPRVWKLKKRRRQEIEIKECVRDGSEVLTENQQADTFVSMTKELFGQPAAGNAMTLDALLSSRDGREEAAAPSHRKQAALLPTSAASSSSCSNPFGTGGAFGSLGGTEVLPTDSSVPGGVDSKANPKAKGKAAAKKPAGQKNSGGRGRPKRPRMDIADEWLLKFGESDHSHVLWREAKTNSKLLARLHDELTSEIHNVDEMEVGANEKLGVLQVVVKKIYIAMKILSAFTAGCNSAYSSHLLTAIDEMQLLMTLEPVVDDFPWPKFLLQVQHESKIAGITEVGEFWAMLDERKLSSAGYRDAADGPCILIRSRLCDTQRKLCLVRFHETFVKF